VATAAHATATRAPEPAREKAHSGGECCADELQNETALPRFLGGIQGKFEVGPPGDAHEREADAVSDAVQRRAPVQPIQLHSHGSIVRRKRTMR